MKMNKSNKQYYRKLTTNSYNQDFIYYKQQKEPSKSPRFKKHANNYTVSQEVEIQNQPNHSKIQSMKNTLNTLFEPLNKTNSKTFNKSVVQYPTYEVKKTLNNQKSNKGISKNIYDQISSNSNYNVKLQILTSKLRQIAQKPHFTSMVFQSSSKKSNRNFTQNYDNQLQNLRKSENLSIYIKNTDIINNKLNDGSLQISNKNMNKEKTNSKKNSKYDEIKFKEDKNYKKLLLQKNGIKTDRQMATIKQLPSNKLLNNYSYQLRRSKSKSSSSFYQKRKQLEGSMSHTSSLKRYPKQLKNDKSISIFHYPYQDNDLQYSQRPRGKTTANLISNPIQTSVQSTKIKINSYIEDTKNSNSKSKKQLKNIALAQSEGTSAQNLSKRQNQRLKSQQTSLPKNQLFPTTNICVLSPHRAQITSIIINSDGKRFLTSSSDYTIKQSTIDGRHSILRKHQGRVNAMRMIDDHLFSGGNDCKVRYEGGIFKFSAPVKEIYSHQKQFLNVATTSSLELYSFAKNTSSNTVKINSHFYKIYQKINKDIYFLDHHNVSIIDWRVPYPLINLYSERRYVDDWISDPYSLDFYQIQEKNMTLINSSKVKTQKIILNSDYRDYCWKKDKVYLLTQDSLQIFQSKKNELNYKISYKIEDDSHTHLQMKNNLYVYGTLDGRLVVNSLN